MSQLDALRKVDAILEPLNDCELQRDSDFGLTVIEYEAMGLEAWVQNEAKFLISIF